MTSSCLFQTLVPSCASCAERVNSASDSLAWEGSIIGWVDTLQNGGFCDEMSDPDQCKELIAFLIPLALPALVNYPRDWVIIFCTEWGAGPA